MTKKDFIALADAFRASKPLAGDDPGYQWEYDLKAVANVLAASNPRFNRERWLGYVYGTCGPNGGTVKAA